MPDVTHPFVSAIGDGGDATLVRPSNWNAGHVWPDARDVGTLVLDTDGEFELQLVRLTLSSTNRLTLAGALTRIVLFGSTDGASPNIVGWPKIMSGAPWRVPDNFEFVLINRLTLSLQARGILEGSCDVILSDDFGVRPRITLTGRV